MAPYLLQWGGLPEEPPAAGGSGVSLRNPPPGCLVMRNNQSKAKFGRTGPDAWV